MTQDLAELIGRLEDALREHIDGTALYGAVVEALWHHFSRSTATGFEHTTRVIFSRAAMLPEALARIRSLTASLSRVEGERDALQRFKEYVHSRLDLAGIPTHPEGQHSAAGCRVGDRLDIVVRRMAITATDEHLVIQRALLDCEVFGEAVNNQDELEAAAFEVADVVQTALHAQRLSRANDTQTDGGKS